ncbi:hypothetical protein COT82_00685 [Candidatus Campbellbacteria bacterium CG10_big_fil_rev_8_21_14_0_10_35_52]|uniref:ABC transmembrane type-1 domain-containing protein n=1 Tax=Candidatus Campbellbacteria bacterium CG10_big_fil_rev_8_21_14_0_10_35_52 TaxID=1974527 RepID=A0A2M6WVS1_9BACT|nr:MAG: hypothetical protein COT82_00685 [Candidatus Campbellbacteria bacterium CG10_big_fil_rev_8_21_14_0_10_35_52]
MHNKNLKNIFWWFIISVGIVILYLPLLANLIFSFHQRQFISYTLECCTFQWWKGALADPLFISTIFNSILLGLLSSFFAILIGLGMGFFLYRIPAVRNRLLFFLFIPAITPPLLAAFIFLLTQNFMQINPSLLYVMFAHVAVFSPIVVILLLNKFLTLNPDLESASKNLGASTFQSFRSIFVPLLFTEIVGTFLIVLLMSWNEFTIVWFVGGTQKTLSVAIWTMLGSQVTPEAYAIGSFLTIISIIIAAIGLKIYRIKEIL